jgi:AcrR family transcriptional regulator
MKTKLKMSSDERRAAIIRTVGCVFAEKGFHGTTTRELAKAAGVSEALLFRHFPNKEALFSAIKSSCTDEQTLLRYEKLKALEPSASTLVLMVHFLVSKMVVGSPSSEEDQTIVNRLMLRSLAEDGEFARVFLRRIANDWIPKVEESIQAAVAAGEAVNGPVSPALRGWFAQHLTVTIVSYLLPATPAIKYGVPREQLVEQAVWFALRGMGLKEEAIRRHYNPRALALFDK